MSESTVTIELFYTREEDRNSEQDVRQELKKAVQDQTRASDVSFAEHNGCEIVPQAVPVRATGVFTYDDGRTSAADVALDISQLPFVNNATRKRQ